jgi:putative endonuclease
MHKRKWVVYLIRCSDESLYCGVTNNLKNRLATHNLGKGAKYTRSRRPVELVGASSEMTKSDALKLEYRIKQVPAGNKNFELTKEENKMPKNLLKELQAVNKDLNALSKKVDKMIVAVGKLEKPKTKVAKAKPAKKRVAKEKPLKKVAAKKPAAKKTKKSSAADIILGIIKRHRKGIEIDVLKKKSGLANQIIYNTVSRLRKQGTVKSEHKGFYEKV